MLAFEMIVESRIFVCGQSKWVAPKTPRRSSSAVSGPEAASSAVGMEIVGASLTGATSTASKIVVVSDPLTPWSVFPPLPRSSRVTCGEADWDEKDRGMAKKGVIHKHD